jgi:tetratricopeptide (TPR) repeat protein
MPRPSTSRTAAAEPPLTHGRWRLGLLLPVAAAALAYGASLDGSYAHDDHSAIAANAALQAGDWWQAAFGTEHSPLSGRPVACASFACMFAAGIDTPAGHRLLSLLAHGLNAVLLAAVLRRTLRGPRLAPRFGERRAAGIALAVATVFAVHPLTVDAVAYPTQRSMLLMATALLTTLYATLRAQGAEHPRRWRLLAIAALALGMGCKEELAAAPLLVVLFQRAYLDASWTETARRWRWHAGLAGTWGVLLACVLLAPPNRTVGYDALVPVSAGEWLLTQAPVVVHYARLALWPDPLLPVYDWPIVRTLGPSVLPGSLVLTALAGTAWLWRRRPASAWLGTLWFLLLAPTSSVLPIVTELVAERRTYLPLLALVVPAVLLLAGLQHRLLGGRAGLLVSSGVTGLVVLLAIARTRAHAEVYGSDARLWDHCYRHNELTNRSLAAGIVLANQAALLRQRGLVAASDELLDRAAQSEAMLLGNRVALAASLLERGREPEALAQLRALLAEHPGQPTATITLCLALAGSYTRPGAAPPADLPDRLAEARQRLEELLQERPQHAEAHNLLGIVLGRQGDEAGAESRFRAAVALAPDFPHAHGNLVQLLRRTQRAAAALAVWRPFAQRHPADAEIQYTLAQLCRDTGDHDAAQAAATEVLRLQPQHAGARALLAALRRGG